jgi:hypothetical protein
MDTSSSVPSDPAADRVQAPGTIKGRLAADKETRDRWIGVYIGILAGLLAVCTMLGNNVTKDANRLNIEAANVWNFFQAKNLRRNEVRLHADALELQLAAEPAMPEAVRRQFRDKIAGYRALEMQLSSDPERKEGLDELFARGKELEAQRDDAFRRDPYFDWAQTLLQIAVVLASVCLITANLTLLWVSVLSGIAGTLLMLDGKFMVLPLPFLG